MCFAHNSVSMLIVFTVLTLLPVSSIMLGTWVEVSVYWMNKFSKSAHFLLYYSTSFDLIEIFDMFYYRRFFCLNTCYDHVVLFGAWRKIPTENWVPSSVPFASSHDNTSLRYSFKCWTWNVNLFVFTSWTDSLQPSPSCSS